MRPQDWGLLVPLVLSVIATAVFIYLMWKSAPKQEGGTTKFRKKTEETKQKFL